jgi:flagellar biosynthesis/type III secretory pathway M-ring protein FliF/YscJ
MEMIKNLWEEAKSHKKISIAVAVVVVILIIAAI